MSKSNKSALVILILSLVLILALSGCFQASFSSQTVRSTPSSSITTAKTAQSSPSVTALDEAGRYTTPNDVAAYLHVYHRLPSNFITKQKAMTLGWKSEQGNLWDVTNKLSIGGDSFGNREGLLPKKSGRLWYECDVNYQGGFRGDERIVYSNDGLIYYTNDHYQTFTRLY